MSHFTAALQLMAVEDGRPEAASPGTDDAAPALAAPLAASVGSHVGTGVLDADPDKPHMRSPMRSNGHRGVPPVAAPLDRGEGVIVGSAGRPGPHQRPDRRIRLPHNAGPRLPGNRGHRITPRADR